MFTCQAKFLEDEKMKPQITQILVFFLFVFSHLLIFQASQLPSFRVPLCTFVAKKISGGFWASLPLSLKTVLYYNDKPYNQKNLDRRS